MRFSVKRLRRWVVAAAVLLLVVTAGFFLYGRYRFRRAVQDLPARLGANIQQTATEFSYSQSSQGHTLFTLQASKEFQFKSGHVLLHNVDITLYGPPGSGRTDHIYGSEFDYDQAKGIAVSRGQVRIQLAGMSAAGTKQGSAAQAAAGSGSNTIQVRTSAVTFLQKTGEASTAAPVHFQLPRASGSAVGADYNAKSGTLVLDSQIRIMTSQNGKPAAIGASHATMDRSSMQAHLTDATLDTRDQRASSDLATIGFRKDGTASRIDAEGHVRLTTAAGAVTTARTAILLLNAKSEPLRADLGGGVTFVSQQRTPSQEAMHGSAQQGTLIFVASGPGGATELHTAEFRTGVSFDEQTQGKARTERRLRARKLDLQMVPRPAGQAVEVRRAAATGNPILSLLQSGKGSPQTTRISADTLVATLGPGNTLRDLTGTGNSEIVSQSGDGSRQTSRGDLLHATFAQPAGIPKSRGKRTPRAATQLELATQDGNVFLTEIPAAKPGAPAPETLTASAQHAQYSAASQVLRLTGHPRVREGATVDLSARTIDYYRATGDATAEGDVKATYTDSGKNGSPAMGGSGPVHVIADRAQLDSNRTGGGGAKFYGGPQDLARLWQGPNTLLAPVIQLDRAHRQLHAWGSPSSPQVEADFTSAAGSGHRQRLVRLRSETLVYSDVSRQADFHGHVTAVQGDQFLQAADARVYLTPAPKINAAPRKGSQIERVVATGDVVFTQPGRKGQGTTLVYTAADSKYVLTGAAKSPARLWDREHGTTTGDALIFNTQDDSVEVIGGNSSAVTQTRAPR